MAHNPYLERFGPNGLPFFIEFDERREHIKFAGTLGNICDVFDTPRDVVDTMDKCADELWCIEIKEGKLWLTTLIGWTKTIPNKVGVYRVKIPGQHSEATASIFQGEWKQTQNPSWLYVQIHGAQAGPQPLQELNQAHRNIQWFGPLPPAPKEPDA